MNNLLCSHVLISIYIQDYTKIKHLWWKACCNAVPIRENLFARRCYPSPFCKKELESIEHIIFKCWWVHQIWDNMNPSLLPPPKNIFRDVFSSFGHSRHGPEPCYPYRQGGSRGCKLNFSSEQNFEKFINTIKKT